MQHGCRSLCDSGLAVGSSVCSATAGIGILVHISTDSSKVGGPESDVPQWLAYAVQREMGRAAPDTTENQCGVRRTARLDQPSGVNWP